MVGPLPPTVRTLLEEAGFTGTELDVLQYMLNGEPWSLRGLGAKMGKSTGTLDKGLKRLLNKKIAKPELHNGNKMYVVGSLDSVLRWYEQDREAKRLIEERKHKNIASYIRSVHESQRRPSITHYSEKEGLEKAYDTLLEGAKADPLYLGPIRYREENSPLRDYWIHKRGFFEKRRLKVRVLTTNTSMARRFQSRDAFEFRETRLLEPGVLEDNIDTMIVGDKVLQQYDDFSACILHYKEFAQAQRRLFGFLWNQHAKCSERNQAVKIDADESLISAIKKWWQCTRREPEIIVS